MELDRAGRRGGERGGVHGRRELDGERLAGAVERGADDVRRGGVAGDAVGDDGGGREGTVGAELADTRDVEAGLPGEAEAEGERAVAGGDRGRGEAVEVELHAHARGAGGAGEGVALDAVGDVAVAEERSGRRRGRAG